MAAKVGKCVCPWGRVLSKPEAQRRQENHREAQPPPTRQEKTPQRAGQANFGHGADLRKHLFRKLLHAAAAGFPRPLDSALLMTPDNHILTE
jgi:hypothetical protein